MAALDTNILVRHFTQDDPAQVERVDALFYHHLAQAPVFISAVTVCELVWVLRRAYQYEKTAIIKVLDTMVHTPSLTIEHDERMLLALQDYRNGTADFADYLNARIAEHYGAAPLYTFDRQAAQHPLITCVP